MSHNPVPPPTTVFGTLRRLGPGLIIAGAIVGSGELVATTKVGAEAGFWLLWLIIIGCVVKVFTQIEFGRHTIVHSETPMQALDSVPGPRYKVGWILWYWVGMMGLLVTMQGGVLGGVGQALAIAYPLTDDGAAYNALQEERIATQIAYAQFNPAAAVERATLSAELTAVETRIAEAPQPYDTDLWATALALLTALVLYFGRYRLIQTVSTLCVGLFTLVTIATFVGLQNTEYAVTGAQIAQGLQFRLPPAVADLNPLTTALAAFGLIGIGAGELIMYPYWCLEQGYARHTGPQDDSAAWLARAKGWIRVLHVDAWLSMAVYTGTTILFFLMGASVLGQSGLNPAGSDMVRTLAEMYAPVFGDWAVSVFVFGAFVVLYSTFFVNAAGNARMASDALVQFGVLPSDEARQRWVQRLSVIWPLVSLALYLLVQAPVAMILAGGLAQAIMLPILGGAALFFRHRRSHPNLRPGWLWDICLLLSCSAFLIVAVWSLVNLFG
ncbi:MAG: Nramp family divalent metal transporter [Rhodothermales bacterium]